MSLFNELKRRNVFKVGIAYVVVAWLILQVADIVFDAIGTPPWVMQTLLVTLVLGLAIAVFFAWAFELTPEGLKREKDVDRSQSITNQTGRKLDFAIIGLLVLALGYFVYESRFMERAGDNDTTVASTAPRSEPAPNAQAEPTPAIDAQSIAVLPFANRSQREDDLFFTDGIHDDLLTQLAKIGGLKVISRTSVMQYKDTQKPIPEIAQELRVGTILEGGVQRAGNRIRINAQLIDVTHDQHLWAETFDREMSVENIFEIQSEITRQIVAAVRGELTEEEQRDLGQLPTDNMAAYEAYLKAQVALHRPDYIVDNYIEAGHWARQAVDLDPGFAQAWAILVETNGQSIWMGQDSSPARFEAAREALENAERLGPGLAETVAARAEYQYRVEQDFQAAAQTYARALAMRPGDAELLFRLAVAKRRTPDVEGALEAMRRAIELDPNNARVPTLLVETLGNMARFEEAEPTARDLIFRAPDAQDARATLAAIEMYSGRITEARATLEQVLPNAGATYYFTLTELPYYEKDFEKAIATWNSALVQRAVNSRGFMGHDYAGRAWAWRLLGQHETAVSEARRGIDVLLALEPTGTNNDAFEMTTLAELYALAGDHEAALGASARAVALMPKEQDFLYGSYIAQARVGTLALAGDREQALAELEQVLNAPYRPDNLAIWNDPRWAFMKDDDRFRALVAPGDDMDLDL